MSADTDRSPGVIVVTGATSGIGLGLARELARRGGAVTIIGLTEDAVRAAAREISAATRAPEDRILPVVADVTRRADLDAAWARTIEAFGHVDHWINNAGVRHAFADFLELPQADVDATVDVNLRGTINGCAVAAAEMRQQGHGAIWNMEGFGSDGRHMAGQSVYGTTKRAILYLSDALSRELRGTGVKVGTLSPGIVIAGMTMDPRNKSNPRWPQSVRAFRLVGQPEETVTPFLVEGMLRARRSGSHIRWLTPRRALATAALRTLVPSRRPLL